MSEIKADLFLPEAMAGEVSLGNTKLKSAPVTKPKDVSRSLLSEKQIEM